PCRCRPFRIEDRLEGCKRLDGRAAPDRLVGGHVTDGDDLVVEASRVLGVGGALLGARGPCVLQLARDSELARDIDSMPPVTTTSTSPARIMESAISIARMDDAQTLLIVSAGVSIGRPALIAAWRAG